MKTKMIRPIPTMFRVIDRFLASVNHTSMPGRLRAARVATLGKCQLIRAQRSHWFLVGGGFEDINGVRAGNFNCYIETIIDLYKVMYPQRRWNADAFLRWFQREEEKRLHSEAVESLGRKAMDLGYVLKRP